MVNILDMVAQEHEVELDLFRLDTSPKCFQGVVFCDISLIEKSSQEPLQLVWPDEGELTDDGFVFNQENKGCEPLFVDSQTQNLLKLLDHLEPERKVRAITAMNQSRLKFVRIIELLWSKVN